LLEVPLVPPLARSRIHTPPSLFVVLRPPPTSPLFPYTTLFRSDVLLRVPLPAELDSASARIVLSGASAVVYALDRSLDHALLVADRKSTRLNSSHDQISYAVFCLKKKNNRQT